MGLDHDQYSWKGDLIGHPLEENRFYKLVHVVELLQMLLIREIQMKQKVKVCRDRNRHY